MRCVHGLVPLPLSLSLQYELKMAEHEPHLYLLHTHLFHTLPLYPAMRPLAVKAPGLSLPASVSYLECPHEQTQQQQQQQLVTAHLLSPSATPGQKLFKVCISVSVCACVRAPRREH